MIACRLLLSVLLCVSEVKPSYSAQRLVLEITQQCALEVCLYVSVEQSRTQAAGDVDKRTEQ